MAQLPPDSHCARASQFGAAWAGAARAIGAPITMPANAIRATLRPVLERSLAISISSPRLLAPCPAGRRRGQELAGQVRRGEPLGSFPVAGGSGREATLRSHQRDLEMQ